MSGGVINQRIQFLLDAIGADKVVKAFDMAGAGMTSAQKKLKTWGAELAKQEGRRGKALKQLHAEAKLQQQKVSSLDTVKDKYAEINRFNAAALMHNRRIDQESLEKTRNLKSSLDQQVTAIEQQEMALKKAATGWKGFMTRFQPGFLSMMFGGMQLQRVMDGLIRGMITNFKELAVETDPTRIALTRLEGSLKFLKFQIVSASGPLIQKFADWLSSMATFIAKSDPEKLKLLGIAIGSLWVLGFALFNIGQFGTFVTGLGNLISAMASAEAAAAVTNTTSMAAGLSALASAVGVAAGLVLVFDGIKVLVENINKGDVESAIFGGLVSILGGVGGFIALTAGLGAALPILAIGIGVKISITKAELEGTSVIGELIRFFMAGFVAEIAAVVASFNPGVIIGGLLKGDNPIENYQNLRTSFKGFFEDAATGWDTTLNKTGDVTQAYLDQDKAIEKIKEKYAQSFFTPMVEDAGSLSINLSFVNTEYSTLLNTQDTLMTKMSAEESATKSLADEKFRLARAIAAVNSANEGNTSIGNYSSEVNLTQMGG